MANNALRFVLPGGQAKTARGASATSLTIQHLMPERNPGQNSLRSFAISSQREDAAWLGVLEVLFFLFSNKLPGASIWSRELDCIVASLTKQSGFVRLALPTISSSRTPSARAIKEQLFASAVRALDVEAVHRLLEEGFEVNQLIPLEYLSFDDVATVSGAQVVPKVLARPLEVAFRFGNEALANLLISYGASRELAVRELPLLQYASLAVSSSSLLKSVPVQMVIGPHRAQLADEWRASLRCVTRQAKHHLAWFLLDIFDTERSLDPELRPTALVYSIRNGHSRMVSKLLRTGVNPNTRLTSGQTPLWAAIYVGRLDYCDELLRHGAHPGYECMEYPTPLQCAAYTGKMKAVEWLLQHGANIDHHSPLAAHDVDSAWDLAERMPVGKTALEAALRGGQSEIASRLLDMGVSILGFELVLALEQQFQTVADQLIQMGCPLTNSPGTADGENALEIAISTGQFDVAQLILALEPHYYDASALCAAVHMAAVTSDISLIEILLSRRRLYALGGIYGEFHVTEAEEMALLIEGSALGFAVRFDLSCIVNLLIHNGVRPEKGLFPVKTQFYSNWDLLLSSSKTPSFSNPRQWGELSGWWKSTVTNPRMLEELSPLEVAISSRNQNMTSLLMMSGYRPDAGCTAAAASIGDLDCLETLLSTAVADPLGWQGLNLGSSLYAAIRGEHPKIVEYLLKEGVDIDSPPGAKDMEFSYIRGVRYGFEPGTPLQAAIMTGNAEIIDMLLVRKPDIHAAPAREYGATAMQLAAIQGLLGVARKLLDMGASCNEPPASVFGRTSLEGAAEHGRLDMIHLLLNSGAETTGTSRQHYLRVIKLASKNGHHAAATLLRNSRPWDEDDYASFESENLSERRSQKISETSSSPKGKEILRLHSPNTGSVVEMLDDWASPGYRGVDGGLQDAALEKSNVNSVGWFTDGGTEIEPLFQGVEAMGDGPSGFNISAELFDQFIQFPDDAGGSSSPSFN